MIKPEPHHVDRTNQIVRDRLHSSLDYVVGEVLDKPRPSRWPSAPAVHALQAALREAAIQGETAKIGELYERHAAVLATPAPTDGLRIVAWGDSEDPGDLSASERELLQFAFADDIGLTTRLAAIEAPVAASLKAEIPALLSRLERHLPLWASELRALVGHVVLAGPREGRFGGASAFAAWGAILVNPYAQTDRLRLLMTLIHESSHLKLFGAYLDDEIVLNDPEARYPSPLRRELRPMNGLYHAAFVLARMTLVASELLKTGGASDVLAPMGDEALQLTMRKTYDQFQDAYGVIRDHGELTPLGWRLINDAAAALDAIWVEGDVE